MVNKPMTVLLFFGCMLVYLVHSESQQLESNILEFTEKNKNTFSRIEADIEILNGYMDRLMAKESDVEIQHDVDKWDYVVEKKDMLENSIAVLEERRDNMIYSDGLEDGYKLDQNYTDEVAKVESDTQLMALLGDKITVKPKKVVIVEEKPEPVVKEEPKPVEIKNETSVTDKENEFEDLTLLKITNTEIKEAKEEIKKEEERVKREEEERKRQETEEQRKKEEEERKEREAEEAERKREEEEERKEREAEEAERKREEEEERKEREAEEAERKREEEEAQLERQQEEKEQKRRSEIESAKEKERQRIEEERKKEAEKREKRQRLEDQEEFKKENEKNNYLINNSTDESQKEEDNDESSDLTNESQKEENNESSNKTVIDSSSQNNKTDNDSLNQTDQLVKAYSAKNTESTVKSNQKSKSTNTIPVVAVSDDDEEDTANNDESINKIDQFEDLTLVPINQGQLPDLNTIQQESLSQQGILDFDEVEDIPTDKNIINQFEGLSKLNLSESDLQRAELQSGLEITDKKPNKALVTVQPVPKPKPQSKPVEPKKPKILTREDKENRLVQEAIITLKREKDLIQEEENQLLREVDIANNFYEKQRKRYQTNLDVIQKENVNLPHPKKKPETLSSDQLIKQENQVEKQMEDIDGKNIAEPVKQSVEVIEIKMTPGEAYRLEKEKELKIKLNKLDKEEGENMTKLIKEIQVLEVKKERIERDIKKLPILVKQEQVDRVERKNKLERDRQRAIALKKARDRRETLFVNAYVDVLEKKELQEQEKKLEDDLKKQRLDTEAKLKKKEQEIREKYKAREDELLKYIEEEENKIEELRKKNQDVSEETKAIEALKKDLKENKISREEELRRIREIEEELRRKNFELERIKEMEEELKRKNAELQAEKERIRAIMMKKRQQLLKVKNSLKKKTGKKDEADVYDVLDVQNDGEVGLLDGLIPDRRLNSVTNIINSFTKSNKRHLSKRQMKFLNKLRKLDEMEDKLDIQVDPFEELEKEFEKLSDQMKKQMDGLNSTNDSEFEDKINEVINKSKEGGLDNVSQQGYSASKVIVTNDKGEPEEQYKITVTRKSDDKPDETQITQLSNFGDNKDEIVQRIVKDNQEQTSQQRRRLASTQKPYIEVSKEIRKRIDEKLAQLTKCYTNEDIQDNVESILIFIEKELLTIKEDKLDDLTKSISDLRKVIAQGENLNKDNIKPYLQKALEFVRVNIVTLENNQNIEQVHSAIVMIDNALARIALKFEGLGLKGLIPDEFNKFNAKIDNLVDVLKENGFAFSLFEEKDFKLYKEKLTARIQGDIDGLNPDTVKNIVIATNVNIDNFLREFVDSDYDKVDIRQVLIKIIDNTVKDINTLIDDDSESEFVLDTNDITKIINKTKEELQKEQKSVLNQRMKEIHNTLVQLNEDLKQIHISKVDRNRILSTFYEETVEFYKYILNKLVEYQDNGESNTFALLAEGSEYSYTGLIGAIRENVNFYVNSVKRAITNNRLNDFIEKMIDKKLKGEPSERLLRRVGFAHKLYPKHQHNKLKLLNHLAGVWKHNGIRKAERILQSVFTIYTEDKNKGKKLILIPTNPI